MVWLNFYRRLKSVRKHTTVRQLKLIHTSAEDVACARIVVEERFEAPDAIIIGAMNHGIPAAQVSDAARAAKMVGSEVEQVMPRSLRIA